MPLIVHHLARSDDAAADAIMPPISDAASHPRSLYFSDMRRVMAQHTSARIILGGSTQPRTGEKGPGYGGRYPGVVEEAWRTLEAKKPLYVVGGFGGAAALVADILEGKETPTELLDRTWCDNQFFVSNAATIDADTYRDRLGLPLRPEDLADALRTAAQPLLASDAASLRWNGLTISQNHHLFRTRDPALIATLILHGLQAVPRG